MIRKIERCILSLYYSQQTRLVLCILNMAAYIGYMHVSGQFIKAYYDSLYTKEELDTLDDEELYDVQYFEPTEDSEYLPRGFSRVNFSIPEINDDVKVFEYNTSSIYALELCNYDFIDVEDDEQED